MTKEGRLQRGKENYEKKRFLDNSETLEYIAIMEKDKETETSEESEEEDVKSDE